MERHTNENSFGEIGRCEAVSLFYQTQRKSRLMEECIQKRLSLSIEQYYKELSQSISFLQAKDEIRVMKKINKG